MVVVEVGALLDLGVVLVPEGALVMLLPVEVPVLVLVPVGEAVPPVVEVPEGVFVPVDSAA